MINVSEEKKTYRRQAVYMTKELDDSIWKMKMTPQYCRCSYAEIVRILIAEGLKTLDHNRH